MKIGNRRQIGILYGDNWERIYSTTLTEAATSVTISGLDGDNDEEYKLICRNINNYNGGCGYGIRLNNDAGTNYGYQMFYGLDTTLNALRETAADSMWFLNSSGLNDMQFADTLIYAKSGYVRTFLINSEGRTSGTTVGMMILIGGVWNNTADNITSLVIIAQNIGGIGVGSVIELYKKRKKI